MSDEGEAVAAAEVPAEGDQERRVVRWAAACFVVSMVAAVALFFVYAEGGHVRAEGLLLAIVLGGIGCGFVIWARGLLPGGGMEQHRGPLATPDDQREAFLADLEREGVVTRRKALTRLLAVAAGALGAVAVFPIRSLGPGPGTSLKKTPWKKGARVVDEEGHPIRADAVPIDSLLTVFPEGHEGSADGQAVLIRVEEGLMHHRQGREDWAPEGLVAYSKVCTHAGCPVGLYQADTHQLICPCHQSAFDVLDGARPVFGPATRSLPQLPLHVGPDGTLEATGDFPEAIGPGFWNRK